MNTEELKLILDTVREVSQTAGIVGVFWVALHYLVQLATVLAAPIATAFAVARVAKYVHVWLVSKHTQPSGDTAERTKHEAMRLEAEKVKARACEATAQLREIATAAGIDTMLTSKLYNSDLNTIIGRLKGKA